MESKPYAFLKTRGGDAGRPSYEPLVLAATVAHVRELLADSHSAFLELLGLAEVQENPSEAAMLFFDKHGLRDRTGSVKKIALNVVLAFNVDRQLEEALKSEAFERKNITEKLAVIMSESPIAEIR